MPARRSWACPSSSFCSSAVFRSFSRKHFAARHFHDDGVRFAGHRRAFADGRAGVARRVRVAARRLVGRVEQVRAGERRRGADRQRVHAGAGDRAGVAVRVVQRAERQWRVAGVVDKHLVFDGLTDFAGQRRRHVGRVAAGDSLKLFDRQPRSRRADRFAVPVEVQLRAVDREYRPDVDLIAPGVAVQRDRLGRRRTVEDEFRVNARRRVVIERQLLGDRVARRIGKSSVGDRELVAADREVGVRVVALPSVRSVPAGELRIFFWCAASLWLHGGPGVRRVWRRGAPRVRQSRGVSSFRRRHAGLRGRRQRERARQRDEQQGQQPQRAVRGGAPWRERAHGVRGHGRAPLGEPPSIRHRDSALPVSHP